MLLFMRCSLGIKMTFFVWKKVEKILIFIALVFTRGFLQGNQVTNQVLALEMMPVKISFGIKSNVFHPVSDFGSCLWLNTRAVTNRACVKFELFRRFTQTGNNNSTKTLLPVRRRGRTRARERRRERAHPLRSVTCSTCARIGVRTR